MSLALLLTSIREDLQREENAVVIDKLTIGKRIAILENILLNLNLKPAGNDALNGACSGFMELLLELSPETITAAELNAGAAGTVKRTFRTSLVIPTSSQIHDWYGGE